MAAKLENYKIGPAIYFTHTFTIISHVVDIMSTSGYDIVLNTTN